MLPKTRDFLIRSHGNVIGHCRRLMATLPPNDASRTVLERRIAAEQEALEKLVGSASPHGNSAPHPFRPRPADNENIQIERLGA